MIPQKKKKKSVEVSIAANNYRKHFKVQSHPNSAIVSASTGKGRKKEQCKYKKPSNTVKLNGTSLCLAWKVKKIFCNRPLFMGDSHLGHYCYITVCSIYCTDTTIDMHITKVNNRQAPSSMSWWYMSLMQTACSVQEQERA